MNPPYASNLHLKFLEKVINISDNVVSIQPDVWLNKSRLATKFGNYRNIFNGKIEDIEQINHEMTNLYFGTGNDIQSVSIFTLHNNAKHPIDLLNFGFKNANELQLFKKINIYNNPNVITFNKCVKYSNSFNSIEEKYIIPIYSWHGGEDCYDAVIMDEDRAKKKLSMYLVFNSPEEIKNFKNSLKTKFMTWYYWNVVHPADNKIKVTMFRLKDYSKPIKNETFYKIFNLEKDEISIIENYVKPTRQ